MTTRHRELGPLARRLALLRYRAGLKRITLSQLSGVSIDLIHSLEQGRTANPTLQNLLRLARVLGVSVGELVEGVSEIDSD